MFESKLNKLKYIENNLFKVEIYNFNKKPGINSFFNQRDKQVTKSTFLANNA